MRTPTPQPRWRVGRRTIVRGLGTALVGASAAALAACDAGGGPAPSGQKLEGAKLVFGLPGADPVHPQEILTSFKQKYPGIQVVEEPAPWGEFFTKLQNQLAADQAPDIWYGEDGRATGWGPRGFIKDLAPFIKRDMKTQDYYVLTAARDPQGRIWAVPADLQVVGLFYNTAAFDEQRVKYPTPDWTLDDLVKAAQALTIPGKKQYGFFAQPSYITTSWYMLPKLFGAGVLDDTNTQAQFTNPKVRAGLQWLIDLMTRGIAPPLADQGKYPFAPTQTAEGRSAMQFHIYATIRGAITPSGLTSYDVEVVPKGPGGRWATVIANSWVIYRATKYEAAAWEFVRWHSTSEPQMMRARGGVGVPMQKKAADELMTQLPPPPKNRKAFLKNLEVGGALGLNAVWQEWRTAAGAELTKGFRGDVSLQVATEEAQRQVQRILDEFYKQQK